MLGRYIDRPDQNFQNGKYGVLDSICFSEILAHYYFAQKPAISKSGSQPAIFDNESIRLNHLKLIYLR